MAGLNHQFYHPLKLSKLFLLITIGLLITSSMAEFLNEAEKLNSNFEEIFMAPETSIQDENIPGRLRRDYELRDYIWTDPNEIKNFYAQPEYLLDKQKKAWQSMTGAWGKRQTTLGRPQITNQSWLRLAGASSDKRDPGWNNLKGVWGKRSANWNKLQAAWGKRNIENSY